MTLAPSASVAVASRRAGWQSAGALIAAAVWLSCLWVLPADPLAPFRLAVSIEVAGLMVLLALVMPLRRGASAVVARYAVAAATSLVVALKLGELAIRSSLGRPLNLLLDIDLLPSMVELLSGALGGFLATLVLAGVTCALLAVLVVSLLAVQAAQRALAEPRLRGAVLAAGAVLFAIFGLQHAVPQLMPDRAVSADAGRALIEQWRHGRETLTGLAGIKEAIATDSFRELPAGQLLARLDGADVLLVYFESYGRSALEDARYGEAILPRLDAFERALGKAGLAAASGFLTSPTVGGQSWFAHSTLQSGIWIRDQRLYHALVKSDRLTLTKAFGKAGYRTLAVKPAITMPWPEGRRFGYDHIYAAADLGYAGLPYNWVTMPDQYTLNTLQRLERDTSAVPLFAEVSLISSHAPWTPIPPVLDDWGSIGDGSVFSRWAGDGDPPAVVWRDVLRVRHQYTLSIDYVLEVLASYATRFVDERTLLIVVGDHQPAPLITGEGASRDVPIHVLAGDSALLAPFRDWGLRPGMHPMGAPVGRMDAFRDWFLEAFSEQAEG